MINFNNILIHITQHTFLNLCLELMLHLHHASLSRTSHNFGISPNRLVGALRGYSCVTSAAVSDTNLLGQGSSLSAPSIWVMPEPKLMSLDPNGRTSKSAESAFFERVYWVNKCSRLRRGLVGTILQKRMDASDLTETLIKALSSLWVVKKKPHVNQVGQDQSKRPLIVWEKMEEPNNIRKKKKWPHSPLHKIELRAFVSVLLYLFVYSLSCMCLFTFFDIRSYRFSIIDRIKSG